MQVSLEGVRKRYSTKIVIRELTAEISAGSLLAVTGINGAGKTTLLNILAGVSGIDAGSVKFDGVSFQRDNVEQRKKLCYLADFGNLFFDKTILENIAIHLKLWEAEASGIEQKVTDWLYEFDLLELANSHVGTLSRGQYYKTALVCLLAVDPELWLIDEPFASGMDPQGINMFRKYAQDVVNRGNTVVYTTQLLDLAESFSNRVWVIDRGELRLNCSPQEIQEHGNLDSLFAKLRSQDFTISSDV